jgi:hypothetical protein
VKKLVRVCDENLLAGMKMFREMLTFRETSRNLDIYVSAALLVIFFMVAPRQVNPGWAG